MKNFDWSAFRQFARPAEPANERLFAAVAQGYANSVLLETAKRLGDAESTADSIRRALEVWTNTQRPLEHVWHASVSKLGRRVFDEGRDPRGEPLGRLLADLAPTLPDFQYRFHNAGGLPLVYDDRLWPAPGPVGLARKDGKLRVKGLGSAWSETLSLASIRVIQTDQTAQSLCKDGQPAIPLDGSRTGLFGWQTTLSEGLDLLSQVAPYYRTWATRILNSIVLIRRLPNQTMSGSWSDTSGVIYLSEPHSALEAAEVLVHECSHQYFHMVERVSSMRKPSEQGRYFSPPVGRERPLDMILIAYHAFANVLTFYERAFDMGLENVATRNRYWGFKEEVSVLERHLAASHGLTDLGRTIFEAVFEDRKGASVNVA